MNLTAHLAHRQHITSPTLTRAHAGNEAAERLEDVKQAHFAELSDYQEIERIYWEAGPNLRAVIHDHWEKARELAGKRFNRYDAAVAAEHIASDLERKAA
jgi:hypothetical protein